VKIIDDARFIDRTDELGLLVRDLADGQKVFLLSLRRFGKSSLVAVALFRLKRRHIPTVNLTVSSYAQFLEKFAEKVLRAAVVVANAFRLYRGRLCFHFSQLKLARSPAVGVASLYQHR